MPVILHHDPDWPQFAGDGWQERVFDVAVTDRFHQKQGRSIGRWTLTAPDGRTLVVYLKRHFKLPWLQDMRPNSVVQYTIIHGSFWKSLKSPGISRLSRTPLTVPPGTVANTLPFGSNTTTSAVAVMV